MSPSSDRPLTREWLLAHAMAIETEAVDRYEELADQMDVHNNPEVADFFRKMAEIEGKHVDNVEQLCGDTVLPHISPWDLAWAGDESPESPKHNDEVHYLMTPYHAIQLAIQGEQRAAAFFRDIADKAGVAEDVRALADQLAGDELEHVRLLQQWLARQPRPDDDWQEDPDPPTLQE